MPAAKQIRVTPTHRVAYDAVPLLTIFTVLVMLIPARWVVPGLGAAGRPASLFAIGLFVLWCFLRLLPDVRTEKAIWRWVLFIDGAVVAITYALAHDRGLTSAESLSADRAILTLVATAGVVLMASEGLPSRAHVDRLTKRITYIAGAVAAIGLFQFVTKLDPYGNIRFPGLSLNTEIANLSTRGSNDLVRVKSSMDHPIEFAVTMALVLPLSIHHALHELNQTLRRRRFALASLIFSASLLAVSRTAVLAVGVSAGVLLWAWSARTRWRALGAAMAMLVVLRALVPGLFGTMFSLFTNWSTDASVTGRTEDYGVVGGYVGERPWFGRGVGTFLPDQYQVLDNAYLQRTVTTGYLGLSTLVLIFATGAMLALVAAKTSATNQARHHSVALLATFGVAAATCATFDFFFFPAATATLNLSLGSIAALGKHRASIEPQGLTIVPEPVLLRPSLRAELTRRPWWHRFDPDLGAELVSRGLFHNYARRPASRRQASMSATTTPARSRS